MLLRDESLIATGDGSSEEGEDSIDFASPAPNNVMSMLDRIPQRVTIYESRSWAAPAVLSHFATLGSGETHTESHRRAVLAWPSTQGDAV